MKSFLLLLAFSISLCTSAQTTTKESHESDTLKDRDGNIYSLKIMSDNNLWMVDNLKIQIPNSYCYDENIENCQQYGRLYTWESAQAVCKQLGEEWRLPTSDEWQQMAKEFGGFFSDSKDSGKAAYKALLDGGNAGFNAVLGGGRSTDGKYKRLDAHGFYWTATEINSTTAYFCNFGKGSAKLYMQNNGEKPEAYSVRCIKDGSKKR